MKIKFEEALSGTHFHFKPGTIVNHEDVEACRLCAKNIASPADEKAEKIFEAYQAAQKKNEDAAQAAAAKKKAEAVAWREAQAASEAKAAADAQAAKHAKQNAAVNAEMAAKRAAPTIVSKPPV